VSGSWRDRLHDPVRHLLVVIVAWRAVGPDRDPQAVRRSRCRELASPLDTVGVPAQRNTPLRDIYLIVLDGHAGTGARRVFGFDNSSFGQSARWGSGAPRRAE
jgi:hypothetical protein